MGKTLTYKILEKHLVDGELKQGNAIGIRIDQTLTQDATGTTAFLLFESMGIGRVKTDMSISYIDHNMAQFGPENHNDHLYLQTVATKSGAYHSRAGNGICHQVHLERFGKPGATLLGSDSHTPTGGGIGMLAMGAGGMDVAVAMGGGPFYITAPKVIGVKLTGRLNDWVASKDVILKLLSILSTKGNVGCVVEYFGPGVETLTVPQRATITNMGAELGVTTSVFPSDDNTKAFLAAQEREADFQPLTADADAEYDRVIEIDLSQVEPMAACPSSPDNTCTIADLAGGEVGQVLVGSCTNSSYADLMMAAKVLKGRQIDPMIEFGVAPGSRQVLNMLAENGALSDLITAGARILETGCGPCIGQGFSPANDVVSVRTFNRNFAGRTGTKGDQSYLVSPETAVACALTGKFTDPRSLDIEYPDVDMPEHFDIDDSMIVPPLSEEEAKIAEVLRGPTIVVPESPKQLPDTLNGQVVLKCGDKITTDHIMPAGVFLKYRSNVPEYSKYVFNCFNEEGEKTFAQKSLELKAKDVGSVIVGGQSYGQGSSREHAALCPMYLGVRAVLAKSIERIHKANLINFAIVPIVFADEADYDKVAESDELVIENLRDAVKDKDTVEIVDKTSGTKFNGKLELSQRDRDILLAGGLLSYTKNA
ncbi:2,3-dimethylmalate dehydratase large subunit [Anaerohalosphaera lusitana]|uniref:Aconitate hydratase A n=1 Tax=Anaerohalosphaera lusitana TaxID=1936003 RepID=A0A1U9NLC6_9BACT|nr:aconitate hydratase [Anaerohalosphaera lusitana]AQT68370.1 2,3-dimethylmalate dehydratase large subunit [Anaerohalosphaera lusitana]